MGPAVRCPTIFGECLPWNKALPMAGSEGWLFPARCTWCCPHPPRNAPTNVWARERVPHAAGPGASRSPTCPTVSPHAVRGSPWVLRPIHVKESLPLGPFQSAWSLTLSTREPDSRGHYLVPKTTPERAAVCQERLAPGSPTPRPQQPAACSVFGCARSGRGP